MLVPSLDAEEAVMLKALRARTAKRTDGFGRRMGVALVLSAVGALLLVPPPALGAAATDAGQLTWGTPHNVDPQVGFMTDLDCASVRSCRSTDVFGNVFTGRDGDWSPPRWSGALRGLHSLTCPARDFCAALDWEDGRWLVSRDAHWDRPEPIFEQGWASQLSCTSPTFCAAVGNSYGGGALASIWDGVSWSAPSHIAAMPVGLSCASRSFCVVTYFLGGASVFDGTKWGPRDPLDELTDDLFYISCPIDEFCVAASRSEGIVYNQGTWSTPTTLTEAGGELNGVACTVDRECFVLERSGVVHPYRHGDWGPAERIGGKGFVDLDCPAPDFCLAVKSGSQLYAYDGTRWQPSGAIVEYSHGVTGLSCPARTFCMGVDASGAAVRYDGSTWSRPTQIDGLLALTAVSCPSASTCYTITGTGELYRYDGTSGTWGKQPGVTLSDRVVSLDCPTTSFCMALDSSGASASFDGAAWTLHGTFATSGSPRVSCATPDFCGAVALKSFFRWDGTSWQDMGEQLAPVSREISCPEVEFCMVAAEYASTSYRDGSFEVLKNKLNSPGAISCVSRTFCLMTNIEFGVATYDGSSWSEPEQIAPGYPSSSTVHASCSSRVVCTVLTAAGFAIRSHR